MVAEQVRLEQLLEAMPDGVVIADPAGLIVYANQLTEEMTGYHGDELLGQQVEMLVPLRFQAVHVQHRSAYLAEPRARPMGSNLAISARRKNGTEFPVDIALSPLGTEQGTLVVAAIRDATERKQAEARLRESHASLQAATRVLAALHEVTQAILQGRASEEVLGLVARSARDLVGAAGAAIAVPDPATKELVVGVTDGMNAEALVGMRIPAESSLSGEALRTGRPINVGDASGDPRVYRAFAEVGNFGPLLAIPLRVGGRSAGAMTLANPRGGKPFTEEDLTLVQTFAAQAAVALEHARLQERLQRLAATSLASPRPLEEALKLLAQSVVEATDTVAAAIFLLDPDQHLYTAGVFGQPEDFARAMDAAGRAGARRPALTAIESRSVVILEDAISHLLSDPLFQPAHDVLRRVSWDTIVSLPLIQGGRVIGALSGYYPKEYQLSDAETVFLKAVAHQAALVAENAQLLASVRDQAAVEERQRLARELHDSVSQALYGIALGTRTAQDLLAQDPARVGPPLDYVRQMAEVGLAEMRALIFELRPESLEKEGLVAALSKQAAAFRARHGIAVEEVFAAEPPVPLEVKLAVLRIAQEALHNAAKHARPERIEVRLEPREGALLLEVGDDGLGFDPAADFPGHLGLRSMGERAFQLGGTLEISSAPGRGTRIRATIPVTPGA